jgi:hypothetical protein
MKSTSTLLLFLLAFLSVGKAQTKVKAEDIIKQINEGRDVVFNNVEIVGKLDLTDLSNRTGEHSFGKLGNDTYVSTVKVALSFTNCTFSDDVLAYYHLRHNERTYVANFTKDVVFKNCIFKHASEFKYSEFEQAATFAGCTFREEANFKYAEFDSGPSFADVKFEGDANFKYAKFPRETSFQKATFYDLANFKYSKFKSPLNMDGVAFKGSEDFKYTRLDGRSFRGGEQ